MAKFNKSQSTRSKILSRPDLTTNLAGGVAFTHDLYNTLYSQVGTALMGEPKFYKSATKKDDIVTIHDNQDHEIIQNIQKMAKTDPEFVLKLAAYARNELYLRSVSTAILGEASLMAETKPFVKQYAPVILKRADELAEVLSYIQYKIGDFGDSVKTGSLPACIKKGVNKALENFDEYQLAKYNKKGNVTLIDVLRLCHPAHKPLYKKIINDTLATPETWETYISANGSTKENWEHIIPKMGYMALLRNLRNFVEKQVAPELYTDIIGDNERVLASKQFPFRFLSAYTELAQIGGATKAMEAVSRGLEFSLGSVPELRGNTFVAADVSGSMGGQLSRGGKMTYRGVASLFAAIVNKKSDNPYLSIFASDFKMVSVPKSTSLLDTANQILGHKDIGYSTNAYLPIQHMIDNKIHVDRMFLFSDMQCYDAYGGNNVAEQVLLYRKTVNPKVFFYSFDLAGYGEMQIPQGTPNTALIAGFSDKILKFIPMFEEDSNAAINYIQNLNHESYKTKHTRSTRKPRKGSKTTRKSK